MSSIVIEKISSLSSLGTQQATILESYRANTCNSTILHGVPVVPIHAEAEGALKVLLEKNPVLKKTDRSVQMAVAAAADCMQDVIYNPEDEWVINAGSSRGATGIWEKFHTGFNEGKKTPTKTSPLTTLGNISTHVAQHLKMDGFQIDHSITCGSGLQALANGYAWLHAGMAGRFLAIGTEAPLTDFTIEQMQALGIYSPFTDAYPCKPCAVHTVKTNSFVLGEAAVAMALLKKEEVEDGEIVLAGMGTGSETITSPTSVSADGEAFKKSMQAALDHAEITARDIEMIIPHSPGTYRGDLSEQQAIQAFFDLKKVQVINHKFLTGHTLGASGMLSIALAADILQHQVHLKFPYPALYTHHSAKKPAYILVNAMGFGGNAISAVIMQKSGK